jgi:hypothetical protein
MIRWLYVFNYPEGVPVSEGEKWYLGTHTQEAKRMADRGLVGYRTWKALQPPEAIADQIREPAFTRFTELAFEDWDGFRSAVVESDIVYTPPSYGPKGFVYQTMFIDDQPEYDLLREVPRIEQ